MTRPTPLRRRVAHNVARAGTALSAAMLAISVVAAFGAGSHVSAAVINNGAVSLKVASGSPTAGQPLNSGGSATPFAMAAAPNVTDGASCPGPGTDGYRWQTFWVDSSVDVGALTYTNGPVPISGKFVYAMFDVFQNQVSNKNPSSTPVGLISGVPSFALNVFTATDLPAGDYKIGFACTFTGGATLSYWSTTITVTHDAGDPNGFTWQVKAADTSTTTTAAATSTTSAATTTTAAATTTTAKATTTTSAATSTTSGATTTTSPGATATTIPGASVSAAVATVAPGATQMITINGFCAGTVDIDITGPANQAFKGVTYPPKTFAFQAGPNGTYTISITGETDCTTKVALQETLFSKPQTVTTTFTVSDTATTTTVAGTATTIAGTTSSGTTPYQPPAPATGGSAASLSPTLANTGSSPIPLIIWAILLLVFGRMAILLGRPVRVVPRKSR